MILLSRVDEHVCDKETTMPEGLVAHITYVGLLSGMGDHVCF